LRKFKEEKERKEYQFNSLHFKDVVIVVTSFSFVLSSSSFDFLGVVQTLTVSVLSQLQDPFAVDLQFDV
jgi:hypothetical protein